MSTTPELILSIEAFMEVGGERNKLVHLDYANFPLEKTMDEIYDLYKRANKFVDALPKIFRDCDSFSISEDEAGM